MKLEMVALSRLSLSSRMLHSVTLLVLAVSSLALATSPCPDQNSSNSLNVSLTRSSPARSDSYLLTFRNSEEALSLYQNTELENVTFLITFADGLPEAECSNGNWIDNMTLEIMQCDTVLQLDLPTDAVVTQCNNSTEDLVTLFIEITEGRIEDSENDQQTQRLLTSEIIRQCDFTGRSVCADYCNTPDAFRISNDTDDTADTHFAMLSNQEKLSDFCTCLEMMDVNCSESRETCEDFCTNTRLSERPFCDGFQANFNNDFCSSTCQEITQPCYSVTLTNPDTESCAIICRDNLRHGLGSPCDFPIQDSCETAILSLYTVRESICNESLSSEVTPEQINIFIDALRDFINVQDFFSKIDILQFYLQQSASFFRGANMISTCESTLLEEFDAQLRELFIDVLDNVLSEESQDIFPSMISENDRRTPQEELNKFIDLSLERFAQVAIRPTSPVNSVELEREHIYFHISRLNASNVDEERNEFTLRINEGAFKGTELVIPLDGINYLMNETVASVMVTQNLATYLDPVNSFTNNGAEGSEMSNGVLVSVRLLQRQSSSDDLMDIDDFSDAPVKLVVPQNPNFTDSTCVFWDTEGRLWSEEGVKTVSDPSDLLVQCKISHFTSFAVLGSLRAEVLEKLPKAEREALDVVTYVGCAISIVALVLTILALVLFRRILNKGPLLYIHLNLAIALLIVYVLFVATVEPARQIYGLCIVTTSLLHYFLLCSMCWMLSEGVMLYLMIVKVFGAAAEKWYWFMLLGWGVPLPVVILSAGIIEGTSSNASTSYMYLEKYCWLNPDFTKPAIWTFIIPMAIIVVINSVFLVLTLYHMLRGRKKGGAEAHVKNVELVKHGVKATIILLPLLGITWIIGIFMFSADTSVFAWLFTLFNSLQGFLIFTLHVVRNDALQAKFCDRCCKRFKDRSISSTEKSMSSILKLREAGTHLLRRSSRSPSSSCYDSKSSNLDKKNEGLAATIIVNGFSDSVSSSSPNGICRTHSDGFSHASYSEFQMASSIVDPSDDVVFSNGHTPSSP